MSPHLLQSSGATDQSYRKGRSLARETRNSRGNPCSGPADAKGFPKTDHTALVDRIDAGLFRGHTPYVSACAGCSGRGPGSCSRRRAVRDSISRANASSPQARRVALTVCHCSRAVRPRKVSEGHCSKAVARIESWAPDPKGNFRHGRRNATWGIWVCLTDPQDIT